MQAILSYKYLQNNLGACMNGNRRKQLRRTPRVVLESTFICMSDCSNKDVILQASNQVAPRSSRSEYIAFHPKLWMLLPRRQQTKDAGVFPENDIIASVAQGNRPEKCWRYGVKMQGNFYILFFGKWMYGSVEFKWHCQRIFNSTCSVQFLPLHRHFMNTRTIAEVWWHWWEMN